MGKYFTNFVSATEHSIRMLKDYGLTVDTGRWQGVATEGKPDLVTKELLGLDFRVPCERAEWHDDSDTGYYEAIAREIKPNTEWADEHFAERVGGVPMNPDPSHVKWPWWRGQDDETKNEHGKFTHTYSERFWPKTAGEGHFKAFSPPRMRGIRFEYGDYGDVLNLLAEDPYTRQAYLPIFFPEDTGAVHRGRIPCSLGYHFLVRSNRLHMWYEIRSCDAVRHFRDDLYLAVRLLGHTLETLSGRRYHHEEQGREDFWNTINPGTLYFSAHSFHVHMGDYHLL